MGVQRQAFEKAFKEQLGATHYQFDCDENGDYEDRETLCGWLMWQQAQKVAVQEGFVLVPREPIEEMIDAGHDFCKLNIVTPSGFYKAMIEEGEIK